MSMGSHICVLHLWAETRRGPAKIEAFHKLTIPDLFRLLACTPQLTELSISHWCWEADEKDVTRPVVHKLRKLVLEGNHSVDGGKALMQVLKLSDTWDSVIIMPNYGNSSTEVSSRPEMAISSLFLAFPYDYHAIHSLAYHLPRCMDLQMLRLRCHFASFTVLNYVLFTNPVFSSIRLLHLDFDRSPPAVLSEWSKLTLESCQSLETLAVTTSLDPTYIQPFGSSSTPSDLLLHLFSQPLPSLRRVELHVFHVRYGMSRLRYHLSLVDWTVISELMCVSSLVELQLSFCDQLSSRHGPDPWTKELYEPIALALTGICSIEVATSDPSSRSFRRQKTAAGASASRSI
ncbi:hypothetical protein EIP86_004717 [Pleurotus ostreatoroseus]|nr:hypothetical protein EIP86_004717 [Pleurotus ostreatoroseus]